MEFESEEDHQAMVDFAEYMCWVANLSDLDGWGYAGFLTSKIPNIEPKALLTEFLGERALVELKTKSEQKDQKFANSRGLNDQGR